MIRIIINISEHSCISMFLMTLSPNISCFLHCLRPSYFFLSNQLSLKQSQIWIWNLALHCICRMQPFGFKTSRKLLVQTWSKKQQSTDSILCSASQQCLGLRHIFSYNMTSWEHSQSVMKAVRFSVHKSQLFPGICTLKTSYNSLHGKQNVSKLHMHSMAWLLALI